MKNLFIFRNKEYSIQDLISLYRQKSRGSWEEWEIDVLSFLENWVDQKNDFEIPTSGSTGKPKLIQIKRRDMQRSALYTNAYLSLNADSIAIFCLPAKYIAGKMMLVRAIEGGYKIHLLKPSSDPLSEYNQSADFIAITPFQLSNILKNENSRLSLQQVRNVIVGGGHVDSESAKSISSWTNSIYATFGMTESITHFALSRINSNNPELFKVISTDFKIDVDKESKLVLTTPYNNGEKLFTNDIIEKVTDNSFYWKGRSDNVINSGGIKFNPEVLERKIDSLIDEAFIIGSLPDQNLGEKIVLIIESKATRYGEKNFKDELAQCLDKFEMPREIILTSALIRTENKKIDRLKTLGLIKAE